MQDSKEYLEKKAFFASLLTLYGRNVAIEVLEDESIEIYKVHLSESNRSDDSIKKIITLASKRNIEIARHSKAALSRISKNAKQDQGVAIDIVAKNYQKSSQLLENLPSTCKLLALDGITNPQNLGMIIRSAAAGNIDGILLGSKKSAKLSPLVMKASAGTMFKLPIYHCDNLAATLEALQHKSVDIYSMQLDATEDLRELSVAKRALFVLGNESEGVSDKVASICNKKVKISMNRGVESLNVAVTAALISFL